MLRDELPTIRGPVAELPDAQVAEASTPIRAAGLRVGSYQLLFPIGQGGMGTVHAAVRAQAGFEAVVALKMLRRAEQGSREVDAFFREARISAKIAHRNVLSAFEVGLHEGDPFLAMPLVRGVPLSRLARRLVATQQLLEPELATWIACQIADALQAAHALSSDDGTPLGLVHRDVSPQNVLLGFDGQVWLLDFGVAKLYEAARSTETGVVKGKFGYMAPEQCAGQELDGRADLFALGIVLYEMLTGRELYAALPPAVATLRIATVTAPAPSSVRPGLPAALDRLTDRAMALAPTDRFESAAAFGRAARDYLEQSGSPQGDAALAALLERLFAGEREELERKISDGLAEARAGVAGMPTTTEPSNADSESGGETAPLLDASKAQPRRHRWLLGLALSGAVLAVGAALAAAVGLSPSPQKTDAEDAPARIALSSPATPGSPTSSAEPQSSAATLPPPSAALKSSVSASPAPQSGAPATARAQLAPTGAAPTGAASSQQPASGAGSAQFKGEPFRDW